MFLGKKQRKIYNLEAKVRNRDKLIENQQDKIQSYENLFKQMVKTIESNNYGNTEVQLRKIKELVTYANTITSSSSEIKYR